MKIKSKISAYILILFIPLFFYQCANYYEDWQEQDNNFIVNKAVAKSISYYDNYDNDTVKTNVVATLNIPVGTFDEENVLLSLHAYNFRLLNDELKRLEYARLSFTGKDSGNTFVYFMAKDLNGDFITKATKKFDAEIDFKCLTANETYGFSLYKILIPDFIRKETNVLKGPLGYNKDDLYQIVSGRWLNSTIDRSANLFSWTKVDDAVIEYSATDAKVAKVKFSTDRLDYIYCFSAHVLPFKVIRNVSIEQSGVIIMKGQEIKPVDPNSILNSFYVADIATTPNQQYYYIQEKANLSVYKYYGQMVGSPFPNFNVVQTAYKYHPKALLYISLQPEDKSYIAEARYVNPDKSSTFLYAYFNADGTLRKVQLALPTEVVTTLQKDLGWFGTYIKPFAEPITVGDKQFYTVNLNNGTSLKLTQDYKYFSIENKDLLRYSDFVAKLKSKAIFTTLGNSEIESVVPYIQDETNVRYLVTLIDKSQMIFDYNLNFIQMFHTKIHVKEFPIELANKVQTDIGIVNPDFCSRNISIDGTSVYKIESNASKIYIYDAVSYELIYEQDVFSIFPDNIHQKLITDYAGFEILDMGFYFVNNLAGLEVVFREETTPKQRSVLYNFNADKMGESYLIGLAEIDEATRLNITQTINIALINTYTIVVSEITGQQKYYTMTATITGHSGTKTLLFNEYGRYISGL